MFSFSSLFLIIFVQLPVFQYALTLSIPSQDENPFLRANKIAQVAGQIQNEKRAKIIDGVVYPLGDGPIPRPNSLALQIINQGLASISANANTKIPSIFSIIQNTNITKLSDYDRMYNNIADLIAKPLTAIDFSDDSFAQDRLSIKGFSLKVVATKQCHNLSLGLSDNQIRNVCGVNSCGGRNQIEQICSRKMLYTIDLSYASQFNDPKRPYKYVPGVQGYFCVNKNLNRLTTLAIHIKETGLTYSQFDSKDEWILAKMSLNAAEINYQQIFHFAQLHFSLEPIRVEMMRTMSPKHPVYAILEHHFFQIFANTPTGVRILLSSNTTFDSTFAWGATGALRAVPFLVKQVHFENDYFENRIRRDGLDSIPNFKYRDDTRKLLKEVESFLRKFLKSYYKNDQMIKSDIELQSWAKATSDSSSVNGFPTSFKTLDSLIAAMSHIIHLTSIKHHTMNSDATWHTISFPYSLPALWNPLPTKKGKSIDLMKYVTPSKLRGPLSTLTAEFFRAIPKNITLIHSYTTSLLGDGSEKYIFAYKSKLKKVQTAIKNREENSNRPYHLLDPERLPHYVWI